MQVMLVLPIVLPALAAALLVLAEQRVTLARAIGLGASVLQLLLALWLVFSIETPQVLALGDWPAPFGIVLVADALSALMLLLASALGLVLLIHAVDGWDRRGRYFHALWQFQLMGISGAFLTGDFFNLFVFFEVLLIASYGLMVQGGGARRLRMGLQYVVVNLAGSTVFLIGIGLIHAVTGTLNLADLALKVPLLPEADRGLLHAGALLLLLVFALKAALLPLQFWLPGTYAEAPLPVAALFAILTKVGAYAILRVFSLAFGAQAGPSADLAAPWLLPAALATILLGMAGVLAARHLLQMAGFAVVGSMGSLLVALGLASPQATAAALYYLLHSTLAAALLFLVAGRVAERRGETGDALRIAPMAGASAGTGLLFMLAALASVGLPPLSGFVGKLLILDAARDTQAAAWIWSIVLCGSLLALIGFARAGSLLFWQGGRAPGPVVAHPGQLTAIMLLGAGIVALTVFAGPLHAHLARTAEALHAPAAYIDAVFAGGRP